MEMVADEVMTAESHRLNVAVDVRSTVSVVLSLVMLGGKSFSPADVV